jgi:hypothetical protein
MHLKPVSAARRWCIALNDRPGCRRAPFRNSPLTKHRRAHSGFAERKGIAIAQRASVISAEVTAQVRRSTSENERHIDPAGDGQPGASACIRRGHCQLIVFRRQPRTTGRKIFVSNPNGKGAAAPGDEPIVLKAQPQSSERCFKTGRVFFIAHQGVCDTQRMRIERPAERNTRLPKTRSTQILDRGQESRRTNHRLHVDKASNSRREIFRNRTRSPA